MIHKITKIPTLEEIKQNNSVKFAADVPTPKPLDNPKAEELKTMKNNLRMVIMTNIYW